MNLSKMCVCVFFFFFFFIFLDSFFDDQLNVMTENRFDPLSKDNYCDNLKCSERLLMFIII